MGTVVAFVGLSVLGGAYLVNINLVTEELSEFPKTTLKDYCRMVELHLKKSLADYEKVEEHSITVSGQPAIVWTVTTTYEIDGEQIPLKDRQAIFIKDNVAYALTYDVPAEVYDEYADCFDLVISSFKFE